MLTKLARAVKISLHRNDPLKTKNVAVETRGMYGSCIYERKRELVILENISIVTKCGCLTIRRKH